MQQPRFPFIRLAPALFASALLAATTACSITITEPEPTCPALEELCPSLACDNGNVVVDGCPICECESAPTCNGEPPPDGCHYDEECEVVCDPVGCETDEDCGDGFYCAFFGPEPGTEDVAQRPLTGTCEPLVVEPGCTSDADCGEGYYCSFDFVEPPSDREGEAPVAQGECLKLEETCFSDIDCPVGSLCQDGLCVVSNECFVDEDCREGFHCESLDAATGLIALPGGVCVADEVPGCSSDADCNGGTCEITCESDPNCPDCDVCFFVGTCIETGCTVNEDCDAGEICFFGDAAADRAIACPDENNDGQCDFDVPAGGVCRTVSTDVPCVQNADCADGQFCDFDTSGNRMAPPACDDLANCDPIPPPPPPTGVCRDVEATCITDADCARGEVCQLEDVCNCPAVCIDDGNGGCLPCECGTLGGICVPADPGCASDADCAADQICSFPLRIAPCLDADNDGVCDDVAPVLGVCIDVVAPPATCSTDADCSDGEFCSFGDAPAGGDAIVPPAGICVPLVVEDPCADIICQDGFCAVDENGRAVCVADRCTSNVDCADGEFCINGACSPPLER